MSLSIRLARAGAHKKPFYRVVVADKRMPRDGRFIEKIGTYDPLLTDKLQRVRISTERAQHWMARGAQPSRRVALFLHQAGVGEKPAIPQQTKKNLPGKKELERRAAELQKSQQPAAEQPTEKPAEQPTAEQLTGNLTLNSPQSNLHPNSPRLKQPTAEQPAAEQPATDSSSDDKPQEKEGESS